MPTCRNATLLTAALAVLSAGPVTSLAQPTTTPRPAGGGAPAVAAARATPLPAVERFTLGNGLEVAVVAVDAAPVVAVQVWYRVGSKEERRDRRGSAHMFEHIMFKGSARVRPEEHARFINGVGGSGNAATDQDATHYINTVPARHLDFAIELEAERMRGLRFDPATIAAEREVVKEEIRQQENSPFTRGFLGLLEAAFTRHPYAWTAGGAIADLDATTVADLKGFYDTYYQPHNALLVVVGKTSAAEVRASAERHFGRIPRGGPLPRPAEALAEPAQTAARRIDAAPAQIGVVLLGYKLPAARHVDTYALQLASIILGGGDSSRLKRRIETIDPATKQPIGVDAGLQALTLEHPGLLVLVGAHLDAGGAARVEAALMGEVAQLASKGPSADELRKAKNQVQAFLVAALERVDGLAEQVGRSWILTGDPSAWTRDLAELEKVSAADVQRVAKSYLRPEQATTVVIPRK